MYEKKTSAQAVLFKRIVKSPFNYETHDPADNKAVLQTNAEVKAQPNISLTVDHAKIENVIQKIEQQGAYRFLYNTDLPALKTMVDLNIKEYTIVQTMETLLKNTGLKYKILPDNLVVIQSAQLQGRQDIVVNGTVTGQPAYPWLALPFI